MNIQLRLKQALLKKRNYNVDPLPGVNKHQELILSNPYCDFYVKVRRCNMFRLIKMPVFCEDKAAAAAAQK